MNAREGNGSVSARWKVMIRSASALLGVLAGDYSQAVVETRVSGFGKVSSFAQACRCNRLPNTAGLATFRSNPCLER